jgi:hypothetical protein
MLLMMPHRQSTAEKSVVDLVKANRGVMALCHSMEL